MICASPSLWVASHIEDMSRNVWQIWEWDPTEQEGWGSLTPVSSCMSASGCISNATESYTRQAITNTETTRWIRTHTDSHTHTDARRHNSNSPCTLWRFEPKPNTLPVRRAGVRPGERWRLPASSQLTSHQNLATWRRHENSQLNGISKAYVIEIDSVMSPVNQGLASFYQTAELSNCW